MLLCANVGSTPLQYTDTSNDVNSALNAPRNASLDNDSTRQRLSSAGLWIVFIKWIHANKVNAIETRLEAQLEERAQTCGDQPMAVCLSAEEKRREKK